MVSSAASFDVADDITIPHSDIVDHLCCPLGGQQDDFHVDEAM
jgi:hypothetical protein